MDSEMVANSGCDDVSGMTTMSSSNWDHLFMSLNHCGSFLGSEFPVPNIPSQPMPLSKRKKKNCEHIQPKNSTRRGEDEKRKSEQNQDTKDEENYIHVRAKRGHATNSHSLAERVRRERISERMRLLQELVPGCNKITGKAMMLDEIINYVQSLQQQVEFLSMKLATVNPEMNMDIDRILSKEIIQFPGSDTTMPVIVSSGLSPSHSFPRYPFNAMPGGIPSILPLPQHMWNNELHASFIPGPSGCSPASNEMHKTEL